MSKGNLEDFYILVQNNEHLQELLGSAEDENSFSELAARLGEENGYAFSAEDVKAYISHKSLDDNIELRDEELEAVAGGKRRCLGRFTTVCFISRTCWGSYC